MAYDSALNQQTSINSSYDLRGRLASVQTTVVDGSTLISEEKVSYDYNASGLRTRKTVTNGSTTTFTTYQPVEKRC